MNLLVDTHILLWFMADGPELSVRHRELMEDANNDLYVSAATLFEISTKCRIGKLVVPPRYQTSLIYIFTDFEFRSLDIKASHSDLAGRIPSEHKDPFDRMIAAQSIIEEMDLLTVDTRLIDLGARVMR